MNIHIITGGAATKFIKHVEDLILAANPVEIIFTGKMLNSSIMPTPQS